MEEINGCTVIAPADTAGILTWGTEQTSGAYTALIGFIPPGQDPPPLSGLIIISPTDVEHEFVPVDPP